MRGKIITGLLIASFGLGTVVLAIGLSVRAAKEEARQEVHHVYDHLQEQVRSDVENYLENAVSVIREGESSVPVSNTQGTMPTLSKVEIDSIVNAVADTVEYNLIRDLVLQNTVATEQSMQELEISVAQRMDDLMQDRMDTDAISETDKNIIIDTVSAIVKSDTLNTVSQISGDELTNVALAEEKLEAQLDAIQADLLKQKEELKQQKNELSKQEDSIEKQENEGGLLEETLNLQKTRLDCQDKSVSNLTDRMDMVEGKVISQDGQIETLRQGLDVNISGSPVQVLDCAVNQLSEDVTALNEEVFGDDHQSGLVGNQYREDIVYKKGDLVLRNAKLYECISNQNVTGAWDSNKWQQVSLSDVLERMKNGQLKVQKWDEVNKVLYLSGGN